MAIDPGEWSRRGTAGSTARGGRRLSPAAYEIDAERGFLPRPDPLTRLPSAFAAWDDLGAELPKLLAAGQARRALERLPVLDTASLRGLALRRAMVLLSFFGHAYVWETWAEGPACRLPAAVAVPWFEVARRLGRPPVLSYASYALDNWRRLDPEAPIAAGNLALLQNFLGGMDEEWFVVVHVDIEAKAAPALSALVAAQAAVRADQPEELQRQLVCMAAAMEQMYATLARMPERCDPYVYYHRVRPYIHGSDRHPLVYEGVATYGGEPQRFAGETGAQSAIVPALDAALGIEHQNDALRLYLDRMRDYMPPRHRAFVAAVAAGPSIRRYAAPRSDLHPAYNACVDWLERFRAKHLEYAAVYIARQGAGLSTSPGHAANPTDHGTGGTPFLAYLGKHRDETARHRLA
jgi:indoleamine 2,3-dioxygenase